MTAAAKSVFLSRVITLPATLSDIPNLTLPSKLINRLPPLMSRWIMLIEWRYWRPCAERAVSVENPHRFFGGETRT